MRNSDFSLTQNVFQDNSAYHGGTLYAHKSSRIMATNNTFLNNIAKEGGAIYVRIALPSSQRQLTKEAVLILEIVSQT